jgi:adenylate cyclase
VLSVEEVARLATAPVASTSLRPRRVEGIATLPIERGRSFEYHRHEWRETSVAEGTSKRKLAAILSADVVGYGRLMADDEAATVATLKEYRAAVGRVIDRHGGRIVNAPGDNILAEFPSAVEAVQAAVEIQRNIEGRNAELAEGRRMHFRVGVNLGDVIEEDDGTIYGDGVNIAARMEALADSGGICISSAIYDAIEGKLDFGFDYLGEQQVKNVAKPVRVYRVRTEARARPAAKRPAARNARVTGLIAAAVAVVVVVAGVVAWWVAREPEPAAELAAADEAVLALPTGPSIAVLPFANLSGDPEQAFFADGITEEIITALSRFPDLFVIARNSTLRYKGQAVDVRDIGRELGARYVLEGSVRRAAETIRVTAQLLDAGDGAHMWAETYERDLTTASIFSIQDEMTQRVVAMIAGGRGAISQAVLREAKRKRTDDLSAYECVLSLTKEILSEPEHLRLRTCLERTVETDPHYSDAWAALTWIYVHEYRYGFNRRGAAYDPLQRAYDAARRAVELDGTSQKARVSLATAYFFRHELDAFFAEVDRALALNPNSVYAIEEAAWQIAYAGDWDRGVALLDKAKELNPHFPGWYHLIFSFDNYRKDDYAQALSEAQQINAPEWWRQHLALAMAYGQLGRREEAQAALAALVELYPVIAESPRNDFRRWNFSEDLIDRFIDGLRKAGLEIPDEAG